MPSSSGKPPGKLGRVVGIVAALILVLAFALQLRGWTKPRGVSKGDHLHAVLPAAIDGMPAAELPLGPTEAGDDLVRRVLQCDDVFYRAYNTPRGRFELYVAYWSPNKISSHLVASHTPDRCWSDNGWTCVDMKFGQRYSLDDRPFQPAEWRRFSSPGATRKVNVIYWHVVGGRPYPYGKSFNWTPNPLQYWKQFATYLLFGSDEQYFVRLTSEQSFDTLWPDPGFQEVLARLGALGLAER